MMLKSHDCLKLTWQNNCLSVSARDVCYARLNETAEWRKRRTLFHDRGFRRRRGGLPRKDIQHPHAGTGTALQELHQDGGVIEKVLRCCRSQSKVRDSHNLRQRIYMIDEAHFALQCRNDIDHHRRSSADEDCQTQNVGILPR